MPTTSRTLPGLGLTAFWSLGENEWNTSMDANLFLLSIVGQLVFKSFETAEPVTPSEGDVHIITGTGDIIVYDQGAWVNVAAQDGWIGFNLADESLYVRKAGTWVLFTAGSGGAAFPADGNPGDVWTIVGPGPEDYGWGQPVGAQGPQGPEGPQGPAGADGNGPITISTKTANYALVLADAETLVRMNLAGSNTITVPDEATEAFPVGTRITIEQAGAGTTTVAAAGGVTVNSRGGLLSLAGQYAMVNIVKVGADQWTLIGDVA